MPFHRAEATRYGDALNLYFEFRAGGYGGSTYSLNYDAASDNLRGVYDQVVVKQKFDVVSAQNDVLNLWGSFLIHRWTRPKRTICPSS